MTTQQPKLFSVPNVYGAGEPPLARVTDPATSHLAAAVLRLRDALAAGVVAGLHGLRCSEVCGLVVNDLDAGRGALHVATLKHGQPRDIDLKPWFATWLAQFAHGKPASTPLFRTCRGRALHPNQFQRAWRRLSMRWLGREVKFHSLRHTAAQRLWAATKDMWEVRRFLGHRSLTSTMIYVSSLGQLREFMPDRWEGGDF